MSGADHEEEMEDALPWHLGVYDAHCHPTDNPDSIEAIITMKTRALTIMATRSQDQELVAKFVERLPYSDPPARFVIPSFGWHPWFSHQIYDDASDALTTKPPSKSDHYRDVLVPPADDASFIDSLPEPLPLSRLMQMIRENLERHPVALVGEVGLDRAFRIPGLETLEAKESSSISTDGTRAGKRLSPHRVEMQHQRRILTAQLRLAGEMKRAVSVHGVAAHGVVYDTLAETWRGQEKASMSRRQQRLRDIPKNGTQADSHEVVDDEHDTSSATYPPRICLHSYSGATDTLRRYLHASVPTRIFFSFSILVNFNLSQKAIEVIKAVPDDRILAESDLDRAGPRMDALLEDVIRQICKIKGWSLERGVLQLGQNWKNFVFGIEK